MKSKSLDKRPARRSLWVWVTLLAVAAGAMGVYLFAFRKGKSHARAAKSGEVVRGSYKNRAVVFTPEAESAEAPALPVINGHVYDTEGATIAGATLVALTYDLAGNLATRVADTTSDEAGRFEIPLREGTYQVNVSKDGYGPSTVVVQTGDTASVVLPKSGKLTGRVVDEKGNPVRSFTVDIVSAVPGDVPAPPPLWSKRFDSHDGTFTLAELPAWPFVVRAATSDLAPGFSQAIVMRADETREISITLTEGCTLEGKVVDKGGTPVPRVLVNVEERLMAAATADPAIQASTQAVTDDDGTFRIEHVRIGSALVRGYDGDNAPSTLVVEIKDCSKLAPVMLVMTPGGSIEGTARRGDGTPLAGARVSLTERAIGIVNTTSDEEGRYHFDELPPGLVRISVEHEGKSALNFVQVRDGVTSKVDVTLFAEGNGKIEGRVIAGKTPLAGARLLVASNQGRAKGIAMYTPVTGADGTFTVPSLPVGAYIINVMSTSAGVGVQVTKDEVAKTEIDVGMSAAPPPARPSDETRERVQRKKRAREAAQQQPVEEGATPSP